MSRVKRWNVGLAAVLVAAWGCGGGGAPSVSSSNEEATVKGTVQVNGKPLDGGEIVFDPSNVTRKTAMPRSAKVTAGTYEVKTLVGDNSVTVRGKAIDRDLALSANQRIVDVKSGENTVPIELP